MRILDSSGKEIQPDMRLGKLIPDKICIMHHEAQEAAEAVAEQWHYEVVREYPNGGKDVARVIDVPEAEAREARPAWDEYEDILRYIPFTPEELAQIQEEMKNSVEARMERLEGVVGEIKSILQALLNRRPGSEEASR